MNITTTAFCAICQADTTHTVTYDTIEKADGTFEDANIIKLTCENSTPEEEHAIRMSGNVTKDEVAAILAEHKLSFQQPLNTKKLKLETDTDKLTELFT